MCPAVDDQAGALAEALPALGAGVGLLACVHPLVRAAVGAVAEALPAYLALVGSLPSVRALVLGQVGRFTKGLAALGARVRLPDPKGPPSVWRPLGSGQARPLTQTWERLAPPCSHRRVRPGILSILKLPPKL